MGAESGEAHTVRIGFGHVLSLPRTPASESPLAHTSELEFPCEVCCFSGNRWLGTITNAVIVIRYAHLRMHRTWISCGESECSSPRRSPSPHSGGWCDHGTNHNKLPGAYGGWIVSRMVFSPVAVSSPLDLLGTADISTQGASFQKVSFQTDGFHSLDGQPFP